MTKVLICSMCIFCVLFSGGIGFAEDDSTILGIRSLYLKWQPEIKSNSKYGKQFYRYFSGPQFEIEKLVDAQIVDQSWFLSERILCLENKNLGYYVSKSITSPSDDWIIFEEDYYSISGDLYFIFWQMNTRYASFPVRIEKRYYFDKSNKLVRRLQEVYKKDTKEIVNVEFADREVEYKNKITELDFYRMWKKKIN